MHGTDRWRVIGILPPELRARDDVTFEQVVPSVRAQAGGSLTFKSCLWFSTYRIYHRAAERFREGRCFLLGDAAHIHSPMGGQGMNTGLQDAYNLAWKLALVVQGRANPALLDTYAQERMPVAKQLLETTDRAFQLVVADTWIARLLRTKIIFRIAAFAMTIESVRKRAFYTLSQTGIGYPQSALSETLGKPSSGSPKAGDRFPWLHLRMRPDGPVEDLFQVLDDTCFNLLLFGESAPVTATLAGRKEAMRIHSIPVEPANDAELAKAGIVSPSFYLLRPDGHIGLCGARSELSAVDRYLSRWLPRARGLESFAARLRCSAAPRDSSRHPIAPCPIRHRLGAKSSQQGDSFREATTMVTRRGFMGSTLGAAALTAAGSQRAKPQGGRKRMIVDAQIHLWKAESDDWKWVPNAKPQLPEPFTIERALPLMDEAGVERAVVVPPSWHGDRNDYALEAVRRYPNRLPSWAASRCRIRNLPR
jgi:hypothetical protein